MNYGEWYHPAAGNSDGWHTITCGHCGTKVSGRVYAARCDLNGRVTVKSVECQECGDCSVWSAKGDKVIPGVRPGNDLSGLPDTVKDIYNEARDCVAIGANTAAVMLCRKILMNIAVEKKDTPGRRFVEYLNYLEEKQFITPQMRKWADNIKDFGNDSNHEIAPPAPQIAQDTLMFTMQLLRTVYEMQHHAEKYSMLRKK